jgi:hypothetical protein
MAVRGLNLDDCQRGAFLILGHLQDQSRDLIEEVEEAEFLRAQYESRGIYDWRRRFLPRIDRVQENERHEADYAAADRAPDVPEIEPVVPTLR